VLTLLTLAHWLRPLTAPEKKVVSGKVQFPDFWQFMPKRGLDCFYTDLDCEED